MDYSIFDNLFDCIAVINEKAEIEYVNQSLVRFCEISHRSILREKTLAKVISFNGATLDLLSLRTIGESTKYAESKVTLPNKGMRRVQYFVQRIGEARWLFSFRDITLEERLNLKYRAELDDKEETINTLDLNLRENKILLRLAESLYHSEKGPDSLRTCLREIEKSMNFQDSAVCVFNADTKLECLINRFMGINVSTSTSIIDNSACINWLKEIKQPVFASDPPSLARLKESQLTSKVSNGALIWPVSVDNRSGWVIFSRIKSAGSESLLADPLLKGLINSLINVIDGCILLDKSTHDGLTLLHNVSYFKSAVEREVHRATRSGAPLSVCLFDVDHFKKINDSHGHQVGDQVLAHIGKILLGTVRRSDLAARYGGEEFALLLPETGISGAQLVAEKVCKSLAGIPVRTTKASLAVTVSAGCAEFPGMANDHLTLIELADQGLYKAKAGGRNRVCVVDSIPQAKRKTS